MDVPVNHQALNIIGMSDTSVICSFQGGFTLSFAPSFRRTKITRKW